MKYVRRRWIYKTKPSVVKANIIEVIDGVSEAKDEVKDSFENS